jgi:hypothetical protein
MSAQDPELQSQTALKLATAKQKKDMADQAFKEGNVKAGVCHFVASFFVSQSITLIPALMSYHEVTSSNSPLSNSGGSHFER